MPFRLLLFFAALASPDPSVAAELDGRALSLAWGLPFVGILLSIALFPVLAPHFWEHHYAKVSAFWALLLVAALAVKAGAAATVHAVLHTAFLEYIPFILLLLALSRLPGASSSGAISTEARRPTPRSSRSAPDLPA